MEPNDRFLAFLLSHEADLRAFIGALVMSPAAREDVFQEVALTLWRQAQQYDPSRPFGAWARGIAANKVLQHRDLDRRFPVSFSPESIRAIVDAFDRSEPEPSARAEALRACLGLLPGEHRQLIELRYEHELDPHEIGRRTGRSVDAIYQALCRIRARLEECVRRRLASEMGVIE